MKPPVLYEEMKPRTPQESIVSFAVIFGFAVIRMYVSRAVLRRMRRSA